ncbi:MAG: uncharacterized protein PWR13_658 [Archaeoglobi archaeon]|nr:uncharacterized protein [Archaeoglobi archaeon]MDK2781630.1 uncharacterized protein [Archaeoglobi archaeon]
MSRGCELCEKGAKMVLFITGECTRSCFYCPISEERRGRDVIFANERPVRRDEDVLIEARLMDALGTGITGGEPLLKLERVLHYSRLLKKEFSEEHHIHLYTSLAPSEGVLRKLRKAGIDELRFHPPVELWDRIKETEYPESMKIAKKIGFEVGFEIPALKEVPQLIEVLRDVGGFLNLNELEFSETNAEELMRRGFVLKSDEECGAEGSEEIAKMIMEDARDIPVRFCPSSFKDGVQLRMRLKRIAKNVARRFDEITEDGTLVYGVIEGEIDLGELGIPEGMWERRDGRIETAWWILEEIAEELEEVTCYIEERYPTYDGIVVEREYVKRRED